ncbi:MAG TPA: XrtA system polysaccharide deacetylase [Povalibacter sp.]|nr:XrtA system polysaccharide deacetylase [Povalibacter sp.]
MSSSAARVTNAFTIDVEDYFHVTAFAASLDRAQWDGLESRVERNTMRMLELLAKHNVRATFFVLGWVAERVPGLVRALYAAGHEIACHGLTHQLVYKQTQALFREETHRSKSLLEDLSGVKVRGYRAATYSITNKSLWALDVLQELEFEYDSSIFPVHHDLYGIPDAPRFAYKPGDGALLEVPLTTMEVGGFRLPCGGGGYFRLLPYSLFRWALGRVNTRDKQAAVFYCHPWEIDPEQPRIEQASMRSKFRHYLNLGATESRLNRLLQDFKWGRMDEVFGVA